MIRADTISFQGDTAWLVFGDDDNERMFLPAEWATDLDRPCDDCGGVCGSCGESRGRLGDECRNFGDGVLNDSHERCSADCIDGWYTFDIEVETHYDACDNAWVGGRRWPSADRVGFSNTPSVTFRVSIVPGMVLPIHDPDDPNYPDNCVMRDADEWVLRQGWGNYTDLDIFPSAAKGMWAVLLRVAQ